MTQSISIMKMATKLFFVFILSVGLMQAKAQSQTATTNGNSELVATILVPNAFTPNGDGVDDVFNLIIDENAEVLDFRVFNRFGNPVWISNKNIGWDGNLNGLPQPMETYVYCAVVLDKITGQKVYKKGDVTLIR